MSSRFIYIKLKSFHTTKETIKRGEKAVYGIGGNTVNHLSDKGLTSKTCKNLQ